MLLRKLLPLRRKNYNLCVTSAVVPPFGGATASAKSYLDNLSPESIKEVNRLIELVSEKGVKGAIAQAKNSNPFVLDAFHDALVDKLYEELKSRGLIK